MTNTIGTAALDLDAITQRLAIQELCARYAFYCDTFQIEPLMALWVEDDPVFDERDVGTGYHAGQADIRRFFIAGVFAQMDGLLHLTSNHWLQELTENRAAGVCSVIVSGDLKNGGSLHATAYYEDHYARVDGDWKFRSRKTIPYTKPQLGGLTI